MGGKEGGSESHVTKETGSRHERPTDFSAITAKTAIIEMMKCRGAVTQKLRGI